MTLTRICYACAQSLPLSEYWVNRNRRDGLNIECKECAKLRRRTWGAKNREREAVWNRVKYLADPEYFKTKAKEWGERNPERRRELSRRREANRRARKRGAFVEHIDPSIVYEMHGGRCGICSEYVSPVNFHVDHIIPLARNGSHSYINVQPAHPVCNVRKGAK